MDSATATDAFSALAQETRLEVFRLLLREGPRGLPAGEVADRLGVNAATLSHHLALLERSGLLHKRRDSRRIIYAADIAGTRGLIEFLTDDCCQGRPELCGGPVTGETAAKPNPTESPA